jgi:hypothetical protein
LRIPVKRVLLFGAITRMPVPKFDRELVCVIGFVWFVDSGMPLDARSIAYKARIRSITPKKGI